MNQTRRMISTVSLFLVIALLTTSCAGLQITYKPPIIPISVSLSVDMAGRISVSFNADVMVIPTPIGVFSASANLHTPELNEKKVLAFRANGQDTVYELKDYEVKTIVFDPGYYDAINLQLNDDDIVLEIEPVGRLNGEPVVSLVNNTQIKTKPGRRLCGATAFSAGMTGIVQEPVRLRFKPYIPQDLNKNWAGSLQKGEKLTVLQVKCNEYGVWLHVRTSGGDDGWAKEWGSPTESSEATYIVPASP